MIKPLEKTDYPEACVIEQSSNPFAWTVSALTESLSSELSLGFYHESKLLAFVLYRSVLDEAEILHLVCHHQFTNQGIATHLLQTLLDELACQGVTRLFLEVREQNVAAKQLYQNQGFMFTGKRQNYYKNQDNALLMQCTINLQTKRLGANG